MTTVLKPPARGLYLQTMPPSAYLSAFSGIFCDLAWNKVEHVAGQYDFSILDAAKSNAQKAGLTTGRVRPFAGYQVPNYVLSEVGTYQAVDFTNPTPHLVANWWKTVFGDRYDAFMQALAAHIESDPFWIEVAMAMTTSVFSEVFIRDIADASTVSAMMANGYTFSLDQGAMRRMVQIHDSRFIHTRSGLACNPGQNAQTRKQNLPWTIQLMQEARAAMGHKLLLGNSSLDGRNNVGALYVQMYAEQQTLGPPLGYQTHAYPRLIDPHGMVDYAVSLRAHALEPASSKTLTNAFTPAQAQQVAARLKAVY